MTPPAAALTREDYARAQALLPGQVALRIDSAPVEPRWLEGGRAFVYRSPGVGPARWWLVDSAGGDRVPGEDPDGKPSVTPAATGTAAQDEAAAYDASPDSRSPDRRWAVFARGHDLWLRDLHGGALRRLTHDGSEHHAWGRMAGACLSGVRDRLLGRAPGQGRPPVLAWSPDSTRLATWRVDEREVGELALAQSVPPPGGARPLLHRYRMPLPGDAVVPLGHLFIIDVASGDVRPAQVPPITRMTYDPFATRLAWWSADGRRLYALHVQRGGRRVSLHAADAATGAGTECVAEQGERFVFPHHVPLANTNVHEFDPGDGRPPRWTWFSQRSGWGHLELHGGEPGAPPTLLTAGAWTVRDVVHVDAAGGWIWFTACGREPGRDPCLRHLYRVRADGSGMALLTPEDADHEVRVAPDGQSFVDTYSRVDLPPVTVLRRADGQLLAELERADAAALAAAGWRAPLRVAVKARDAETDLHGCLFLPSGFNPARRYPLVDSVYPGPQMIRAPQAFAGGEASRLYWQDQALAELGFVVLALDGLGTPFRSRAFADHAAGRGFGEAGGLADHVAAIAQLAGRYPWIDASRVGISGHSGGGYAAARAMLQFPDVFKVGVATAGNHDQRGYDAGWGEFWIGQPDGDNYDAQDNLRLAERLQGKLLLMHGEMDDNVHPSLTMRLADALIAADKDFDLLIVPFADHAFFDLRWGRAEAERLPLPIHPHVLRRRWDTLVRHLLGATPPAGVRLAPDPPRVG